MRYRRFKHALRSTSGRATRRCVIDASSTPFGVPQGVPPAACLIVRHSARAKAWLARKEKKHGKAKALAILAAKLGRTVYHLWRQHEVFDETRVFGN